MNRRVIILLVAALVATLGVGVVFLYVRTADNRANARFDAKTVLVAKVQINQGETLSAAKAAGKIETKSVSADSLVAGYVTDLGTIPAADVALTNIYPGQQIISNNWGGGGALSNSTLNIPKGEVAITLSLGDPNRVAGFVDPGNHVAIFATNSKSSGLLLADMQVIAVGSTSTISTTTTDPSGTQTTEQLPRTLLTLAVAQKDAQKLLYAQNNGYQLNFALRNTNSTVDTAGAHATGGNLFQ